MRDPCGDSGDPGDSQKEINENTEKIIEEGERLRRHFPIDFFQVDLIRFGSHGAPGVQID
jgi:hypothetical protein